MAAVKWVKITTDMFDNRKIKHLRKLPDGNNIVLIWVMLLTMAGRCNAGGMIFLTENIPYTPKMLADELGFEENTVKLAITALEQLNMVCTDNGFFSIAGWNEYQNIEGMEKIREQTRQRVTAHRQKQKALAAAAQSNVTCNVTVTQSNATEEDIDIDKEKEKEYILEEDPDLHYNEIIFYLNRIIGSNYNENSKTIRQLITKQINEGYTEQDFINVINKKYKEWRDTEYEKYLRPETLFGDKFESYVNQKEETY